MIDFDNVDDDYTTPGKKPAGAPPTSAAPAPRLPVDPASVPSIEDGIEFDPTPAPVQRPAPIRPSTPSTSVESVPVAPRPPATLDVPAPANDAERPASVVPMVEPALPHPAVPAVETPVAPVTTPEPAAPSTVQEHVERLLALGDAWLRLPPEDAAYRPATGELKNGWKLLSRSLAGPDHPDMAFVMREATLWEHLEVNDWTTVHSMVSDPLEPGPAVGCSPAIVEHLERLDYARAIRALTMVALHAPSLLPEAHGDDRPQTAPDAVPTVTQAPSLPATDDPRPARTSTDTDTLLAKPKTTPTTLGNGLDLRWVIAGALGLAVMIAVGGWWFARPKAAPTTSVTPVTTPAPVVASTPAVAPAAPQPMASTVPVAPAPMASVPKPAQVPPAAPAVSPVPSSSVEAPTEVHTVVPPDAPMAASPVVETRRAATPRAHASPSGAQRKEQAQMDAINADLDRKLKALQNQ